MLMRTPQSGRIDNSLDPIEMVNAPKRVVTSRRGFLGAALGLGASAVPMLAGAAERRIEGKVSEATMDKLDGGNRIVDIDGGSEALIAEHGPGVVMPTVRIEQYINQIVERAERTRHGVHMQEHENVEWVIDYFNQMKIKKTDPRVLYYPSKVEKDSKFVRDFINTNKEDGVVHKKVSVPTSTGSKEMTIYMASAGETMFTLPKVKAVRAAVDVGTAYVILPKGTHIIEKIEYNKGKEMKTYMIAACRNLIYQTLNDCPPVQ